MAIHIFECSCCKLPFARIQNGVLIIESRHHGEKHTNVIALAELLRMISADEAQRQRNTQQLKTSAELSKLADLNCEMARPGVE